MEYPHLKLNEVFCYDENMKLHKVKGMSFSDVSEDEMKDMSITPDMMVRVSDEEFNGFVDMYLSFFPEVRFLIERLGFSHCIDDLILVQFSFFNSKNHVILARGRVIHVNDAGNESDSDSDEE